jgi:hypothetical protein
MPSTRSSTTSQTSHSKLAQNHKKKAGQRGRKPKLSQSATKNANVEEIIRRYSIQSAKEDEKEELSEECLVS